MVEKTIGLKDSNNRGFSIASRDDGRKIITTPA
jgi:hypothetical protein